MTAGGVSKLRELQLTFWQLLQAPEGVEARFEALLAAGEIANPHLDGLIRSDARLSSADHVEIYSTMYFVRLHDCLAEDYPKLSKHLGAVPFRDLVIRYLLAHPPAHFSLRELGRLLPEFVTNDFLAAADSRLAGLAHLEWARTDVFDELDVEVISRESLLDAAGANPEGLRVRLVPAARLLHLEPGVLPLWRALADDGPAEERIDDSSSGGSDRLRAALVWRSGFAVHHRSLPPDEAHCLESLLAGAASIAGIAESLVDAVAEEAGSGAGAQRFAELLDRWTADSILTPAQV